jgi:hypothetical protein
MKNYCLTHITDEKATSYLFKSEQEPDAGEVAAQLNIDFSLFSDEKLVISEIDPNSGVLFFLDKLCEVKSNE